MSRERAEKACELTAIKRIWARICKRLSSPGIDSKESIPPAYVAWLAGTSNKVFVPARQAGNRFLGSLKAFQIRALDCEQTRQEQNKQELLDSDSELESL